MCIICAKPIGVKAPTREMIDNMCSANPDGFGMAVSDGKSIKLFKTMSENKYKKWCKSKVKKEYAVVYHMRIATHGSKRQSNCHPWTTKDGKWAFAHNGILSISNEKDMTDSETFLRRIAEPMLNNGILPASEAFDAMVQCVIGSSKFAFLSDNGHISMYGNFIKDDGLYFSNSTYESRRITHGYDWDKYFSHKYSTPTTKKCEKKSDDSTKKSRCDEIKEELLNDFLSGYIPSVYEYDNWYDMYVNKDDNIDIFTFHDIFQEAIDEAEEEYYAQEAEMYEQENITPVSKSVEDIINSLKH